MANKPELAANAGDRPANSAGAVAGAGHEELRKRGRALGWFTLVLALVFALPLFNLVRFALAEDLYSYILIIPATSGYLVWTMRERLRPSFPPALAIAALTGTLGIALLIGYWAALNSGWQAPANDRLFLTTLAFLLLFWSGCALVMGKENVRAMMFPLGFLLFMAPLPLSWQNGLETFLQHTSAEAAYLLIKLFGTPIFRDGTLFNLPGIQIEVAPECSGIRATLMLFILGLLAGQFFLAKPWAKAVLAVGVIVLGIARNAVRITVLAELAVHLDPGIVDSALHRRGGPWFFAVSLIPFFLLIWFLRKVETRRPSHPSATL